MRQEPGWVRGGATAVLRLVMLLLHYCCYTRTTGRHDFTSYEYQIHRAAACRTRSQLQLRIYRNSTAVQQSFTYVTRSEHFEEKRELNHHHGTFRVDVQLRPTISWVPYNVVRCTCGMVLQVSNCSYCCCIVVAT